MREIKFRAWNGHSMEYGGFCIHATAGKIMPTVGLTDVKEDSPIMQFTGLKDKNGKEIYEGDIIRHLVTSTPKDMYEDEQVIWAKSSFNLQGKFGRASFLEWPATCCLEIIGNIHENKTAT